MLVSLSLRSIQHLSKVPQPVRRNLEIVVIVRKVKIRWPLPVTPAINSNVAVPPPTKVKVVGGGPSMQLCGPEPKVVKVRFVRLNDMVMGGPLKENVPV